MTLREVINNVLKEESNPQQIANKFNSKISELKRFSNTNFNGIITLLANEISKNGIPIGNGKFINPSNKKELDSYINQIYNNIIINDNYTDEVVQKCANTKTKNKK